MVSHMTHALRTWSNEELLTEQISLLQDMETSRRKKIFEDVLSKVKGEDGSIIEQWRFIDYQDAGEGWREGSRLFCECGRKLRYQYTLENKRTGLRKSFGLNHLTEHTGIPPELAREIVKQLNELASDKNEMLQKWKEGWTLECEGITCIPSAIQLPENILRHIRCKMPLLQHQVSEIKKKIEQHERFEIEKKLQAIVAQEKAQLRQNSLHD